MPPGLDGFDAGFLAGAASFFVPSVLVVPADAGLLAALIGTALTSAFSAHSFTLKTTLDVKHYEKDLHYAKVKRCIYRLKLQSSYKPLYSHKAKCKNGYQRIYQGSYMKGLPCVGLASQPGRSISTPCNFTPWKPD